MFKNYFLTAFRFLIRQQTFTAINIVGLAVSITSILLIFLYVKNELTFDRFHRDRENLYILGEGDKENGNPDEASYYQTVYPALPALLDEFPEIETGTRYFNWEEHVLISGDKKFIQPILYVDTSFFSTLTFSLIKGEAQSALSTKNKIVISTPVAMKLFNTVDALGKTVEFETGNVYTVSGVLDQVPENSSIRPDVLISLAEKEADADFMNMANWYNTIAQVIIRVKPGADVPALKKKLNAFVKEHYAQEAKDRVLKIYPFPDFHAASVQNKTLIYGLASIGVFILIVAVINFMNLSIASSFKRLRETGVRRVMGSVRSNIFAQFFTEASCLCFIAVVLSIGLVQVILPMFNDTLNINLTIRASDWIDIAAFSIALTVVIALVAGGYPALYLASFKTVLAVKGIIPYHKNKLSLRNSLIVIQFVVSVALIAGVAVTTRQLQFLKNADLKFSSENVAVINLSAGFKDEKAAWARIRNLVSELRANPKVLSLSTSRHVPGRYAESYNGYLEPGTQQSVSLRQATVDENFFETYQVRIKRGRNFSDQIASDSAAVIINEAAANAFGWDDPIGKTIVSKGSTFGLTVIGVTDDFHYRSLQGKVQPLIHFYLPTKRLSSTDFLSIRLVPNEAKPILADIEKEWASLDSWSDFTFSFADELFNRQYQSVEAALWLITAFAFIAIILSCAGIFALSAINAQHRIKEIGIRKVMGASVSNLVVLMARDYIRLVAISCLFAIPLAWYSMSTWLEDFAYRINMGWAVFATSGLLAIVIAFLTVSVQSLKAALINPAESLKND